MTFFKTHDYSKIFYAWIGSRLTHMHASAGHYIYREYDRVSGIYFLHKGIAGYALQKYKSIYILIEAGDMFGVVDTASEVLEESFESESSPMMRDLEHYSRSPSNANSAKKGIKFIEDILRA